MIFPQLGVEYYTEQHRDIISRMEAFYSESITINQAFWAEADTDTRFEAGDQNVWNAWYGNLPANQRKQYTFNRINRVINMIDGHQRRNRKSIIATPVENGDSETADQFTKILMYLNNTEMISETVSDAFRGSCVTGMNLLQVWMDYRQDPVSGNIRVDNCSYNSFLIDPFFKKMDLSDCNGIWKRSFLTRREVISLLPDLSEEVLGLYRNDGGTGRDGKFQFMPESYGYAYNNLLTYDEYYYRDYRKQQMLVDTQTGETMEWKSNDKDRLNAFLQQFPTVILSEQDIPTVNLAIVVQGKVMYTGPQPMGIDSYPFVPVFSYYRPQMPYFDWRLQGVVRGLRDAQALYNRRKVIELDIMESQINSGWIATENSVVNPSDLYTQSGQGKTIWKKEGSTPDQLIQIQAPRIDPSVLALSERLGQEISEISGVNEELLGSAMDDKAGVLSMLRQGAGLTTLQGLFDNLDFAQKLLGKLLIDLIQANYTPGKVKKILEGAEPTPQFYNKAFGKYHAVVEDGLNTATQKQMQFAQMLQLREVGVPISDEDLLEAATISGKKKILENMAKTKQMQMQQQSMQMQAGIEEQQARTELAKARAVADQGLGLERISRVEENEALAIERRAAAEKDHDMAFLNVVKALKELDGVDVEQVHKMVELSQLLKQHEMDIENHEMAKQQAQQPEQSVQA